MSPEKEIRIIRDRLAKIEQTIQEIKEVLESLTSRVERLEIAA